MLLSGSWSVTPSVHLDSSPTERLCVMHKLCLLSQHAQGGSLGPLCMSRCPFGSQCSSCFLQPCNAEVLLAFPSASVIRCKRGCDTKVTLLSPRMDFPQLTRVHGTAVHSPLVQVPDTEGGTEDRGSGNSTMHCPVTKGPQSRGRLNPFKTSGTQTLYRLGL